jgi:hypothetical protein
MDTGMVGIDADVERVLSPELTPGERLQWTGRPRRGLRFTAADLIAVPFSILWCGFAIFWESHALTRTTDLFFALWGIPFVAIGLYMVFGRFIFDAIRRRKIAYGLTSRRLILVSGVFSRQLKSIELDSLGETSLKESRDGSGTVILGASAGALGASAMAPSWPGAGRYLPPMLEAIDNARAVYEKIRALKMQGPQH